MIEKSYFMLKTKAHVFLVMKAINQSIKLFKARYCVNNKKELAGNPSDLDVALYLKDCLCHIMSKEEFCDIDYLSDKDLTKMLNIAYELVFIELNE